MASLTKFLIVIAGLTILLTLSGIPTGIGLILEKSGVDVYDSPEDLKFTTLYTIILALLAGAIAIGIAIGFLTKASPLAYILIPYVTLLATFVGDIVIVTTYASGTYDAWVGWLTALIMIPLAIIYLHSLVSWWSGRSS